MNGRSLHHGQANIKLSTCTLIILSAMNKLAAIRSSRIAVEAEALADWLMSRSRLLTPFGLLR